MCEGKALLLSENDGYIYIFIKTECILGTTITHKIIRTRWVYLIPSRLEWSTNPRYWSLLYLNRKWSHCRENQRTTFEESSRRRSITIAWRRHGVYFRRSGRRRKIDRLRYIHQPYKDPKSKTVTRIEDITFQGQESGMRFGVSALQIQRNLKPKPYPTTPNWFTKKRTSIISEYICLPAKGTQVYILCIYI